MNNRTVYRIYPIIALLWAVVWVSILYAKQGFQTLDGKTVWLFALFGKGTLVIFLITSLLSSIRVTNYASWSRRRRIYFIINLSVAVLSALIFGVLSNWAFYGEGVFVLALSLGITGFGIYVFYYVFDDDDLDTAGKNSNNFFEPPHRNFFIGLILPVLMAIVFISTPYLWELKSAKNIAWAQSLEIIQFKGEVLISIEDEDDAEILLDRLCFDNNRNWKIGNYSLLIQKHFTNVGEEKNIHFTFDGTERNQALYFRSGDKSTKLDITVKTR